MWERCAHRDTDHRHSGALQVDLFFAGHEHDYESIFPVYNGSATGRSFVNPRAPIHVVSGAGGAPALDEFGDPGPWTRLQLQAWSYGRITVHNASHLEYQQVLNTKLRSVADTFFVVQDKHGPFPVPPLPRNP